MSSFERESSLKRDNLPPKASSKETRKAFTRNTDEQTEVLYKIMDYYSNTKDNSDISDDAYWFQKESLDEETIIEYEKWRKELLSGRKVLMSYNPEFDPESFYDNMRSNVRNIFLGFESNYAEIDDGLSYAKPVLNFSDYPVDDIFKLIQSYLEITFSDVSEGEGNRRIKNTLNREINLEGKNRLMNKVLFGMERLDLCRYNLDEKERLFNDDLARIWTLIEKDSNMEIAYFFADLEEEYSIPNQRRICLEIYYDFITEITRILIEDEDQFSKYEPFGTQYKIRLVWEILLKYLNKLISQELLNSDQIISDVYREIYKVFHLFKENEPDFYGVGIDIAKDFVVYCIIQKARTKNLGELRVQIYNTDYIECLSDIDEKYRFVDEENVIKSKYNYRSDDFVEMTKEMKNEFFNLGSKVSRPTFNQRMEKVEKMIPEFAFRTKRNLDVHDLMCQRVFYQTLFESPPYSYHTWASKKINKDFSRKWKEYVDNGATINENNYFVFSNAISCQYFNEYNNSKQLALARTDIMKEVYNVMNNVMIYYMAGSLRGMDIKQSILHLVGFVGEIKKKLMPEYKGHR